MYEELQLDTSRLSRYTGPREADGQRFPHQRPIHAERDYETIFTPRRACVLSACQTAKGDSLLPEEAIHLAAGMLMAGYGSVVGTLWSIRDDDAPIVAEKFYRYLIVEADGDSTKAAYALHDAVGHLRDSMDGHGFDRWVPFIHLGVCSLSSSVP